jgi:hypothetical protein
MGKKRSLPAGEEAGALPVNGGLVFIDETPYDEVTYVRLE